MEPEGVGDNLPRLDPDERRNMDYELHRGDCLAGMAKLETGSVQLIATDPPYFRVKDDEWDNQWANADAFLQWMDALCQEWRRVLAPNGSLYVFASPQMAWHVEGVVRRHFNVINQVVWKKDGGTRAAQADKNILRGFFGDSERIIFADHYGSDETAMGEAGFVAAEAALKRRIFGDYIRDAMKLTKTNNHELTGAIGAYRDHNHGGATTNWLLGYNLPTPEQYELMRVYLNTKANGKGPVLRREYEDLRREYEDLRREYEDLRRPFYATPDAPYTDVWTFPTVAAYPGKHPAEKPFELMRHIVKVSSRPDDLVLDCFAGSGTTGHAAGVERRRFVGFEKDARWHAKAQKRIAAAYGDWQTAQNVPTVTDTQTHDDLPLFAGA